MNGLRKEDVNSLGEAVSIVKDFWQYRRKGLQIPGAIYDTIQALYKKDDLKPLIMKRKPIDGGWWFLIHLPPGTGYLKFKGHEQLFAEAIGGSVFIERKGKAVHIKAYENELQTCYPYAKHINPADFEKMFLPCHFGFSAMGPVIYDLAELQGILIGGNRGGGKSNLIIGLVTTLLMHSNALLGVIDFKRVDTDQFRDYVAYADDIEPARAMLRAINRECDKRKDFMAGKANRWDKMVAKGYTDFWPIVLFVDELTEMQDEECMYLFNRLLRVYRAQGFIGVAATQRPSSTALKNWGDSKMLFPARVCFSVPDTVNSQIILDNDRGASLPTNIPGRCIVQWDKAVETQALLLEPEDAEMLLKKQYRADENRMEVIVRNEELPKRLPPRQDHPGSVGTVERIDNRTGTPAFLPWIKPR